MININSNFEFVLTAVAAFFGAVSLHVNLILFAVTIRPLTAIIVEVFTAT